jgi:hypothetical protein
MHGKWVIVFVVCAKVSIKYLSSKKKKIKILIFLRKVEKSGSFFTQSGFLSKEE